MYKETFFSIDSYDIYYKGYTDGAHWNGWECPRFTKEVADQVTEWFNRPEDNMPAWYDVDKDAYIFTMDPDGDEVEDFEGVDIEFEGNTLHVYPIGAWCWVWDAYTQEEIDKLHEPEELEEPEETCKMKKCEVSLKTIAFTIACTIGFYMGNEHKLSKEDFADEFFDHIIDAEDTILITDEIINEALDFYNECIVVED